MIAVRRVSKSYRSGTVTTPVLVDLSVSFRARAFHAIVGPSGCGKSTLLGLLGGLDRPDSGTILVDGLEVGGADRAALGVYRRTTVGFVFQSYNLLRSLTAVENVEMGLELLPLSSAARRRRAMDYLDRVGLAQVARRFPSQLSGGMQQRVAVARALAREPKLLLADEPTGNLDQESGWHVFECLRSIQRAMGLTCVMVTHATDLAGRTDQVLSLQDGRRVLTQTTDQAAE